MFQTTPLIEYFFPYRVINQFVNIFFLQFYIGVVFGITCLFAIMTRLISYIHLKPEIKGVSMIPTLVVTIIS